jgi:hypothetical protein
MRTRVRWRTYLKAKGGLLDMRRDIFARESEAPWRGITSEAKA